MKSYRIGHCPFQSLGRSSLEWERPVEVSGPPRTPNQRLWSGIALGWWTSSEPWCRSLLASPYVVWGSWDYNFLARFERIHPSSDIYEDIILAGSHCGDATRLTCCVASFDLCFQLQSYACYLFVSRVARTPPFRFLWRVTFEIDKCHQAVTAGLTSSCGKRQSAIVQLRNLQSVYSVLSFPSWFYSTLKIIV